jgi:membrane protein
VTINVTKFRMLIVDAYGNWSRDQVPTLAAAFAFYAVLALSPLILLAVVIGGRILGQEEVSQRVINEVGRNIGPGAAEFVAGLIRSTSDSQAGMWATIFAVVVAIFSATGLFNQLSESVRLIWKLKPRYEGILHIVYTRLWALLLMLIFAALFIGWVIFDAWLSWLAQRTEGFPGWNILSFVISLFALSLLFAATFRSMPRNYIRWRDVWFAAIVTGVGFTALRTLLSLYFAYSNVAVAYGSAGALIVILLWIYYSSQLYFFGIELACTYAHKHGSQVDRKPRHQPVVVDDEATG